MTTAAPEERWVFAEGNAGGEPFLVRYRERESDTAERAERPLLVLIRWPFEGPAGMAPNGDTLGQMERFEEAFSDSIDNSDWASLVAVLTHNFVREWRLYSGDVSMLQHGLNDALAGHQPYPLEFSTFEDPNWDAFAELRP